MTYASAVLADSPLLYFRLDEASGSWVDSGSNGVSAARLAGALAGGAATMDGGTSYSPPIGTNDSLGKVSSMPALSGASTVEFWLFLPTGNQSGLFTHVGGADGWTVGVGNTAQWQAGRNLVLGMTNVGYTVTSYAFPNVSGWRHVAVSKDAGNNYVAYVNGTQVASGAFSASIQTPTAGFNWGGDNGLPLPGQVYFDEVAAYSGQLSAARILAHYNASFAAQVSAPLSGAGSLVAATSLSAAAATNLSGAGLLTAAGQMVLEAHAGLGGLSGAGLLGATGGPIKLTRLRSSTLLQKSSYYVYASVSAAQPGDTVALLISGWDTVSQVSGGSYWDKVAEFTTSNVAKGYVYARTVDAYDIAVGYVYIYFTGYSPARVVQLNFVGDTEVSFGTTRSSGSGGGVTEPAGTIPVTVSGDAGDLAFYFVGTFATFSPLASDRGALLASQDTYESTAIWQEAITADGQSLTATITVPERQGTVALGVRAAPAPVKALGVTSYANMLTNDGSVIVQATLALSIPDPLVSQTPGILTVYVTEATPDEVITFTIDGAPAYQAVAGPNGSLGPLSIPVPALAAGAHTIVATQGVDSSSGAFTTLHDAEPTPVPVGPDAAPISSPTYRANGTRLWVLQDLAPGGLGSWTMPINPADEDNPAFERVLTAKHTTALNGQYHLYEAGAKPLDWSFSGYSPTQEMHDQLKAYGDLNRRFYLIDHRGRAWIVSFTNVDMKARRRQNDIYGTESDWVHDFTVAALIYNQEPVQL